MKKIYEHKSHRLKNYNYSSNGSYFVTICVKNKECILGEIISINDNNYVTVAVDAHGDRQTDNINDLIYLKSTSAKMILSEMGLIVEKYLESSKTVYSSLSLDNYVIMPNHIHMIISLNNETDECKLLPCHDMVPQYISSFKTLVTKEIGFSIFQRNYHDRIIRNEREYEKIWNYVQTNPSNWVADRFYMYI